MKIHRFTCHVAGAHAYGYIKAGFFERRAIRKLIAAGRTEITEVTWQPGPKAYGAQFIITAKRNRK